MFTSGAFGYLTDYALWWLLFTSLVVHIWCFFRFFPRERYRKTGLILGNMLVFLGLLGLLALGGETYFRFVAVETDSFGMSLPARRWFALYGRQNSLGCRDKEWAVEKPPEVRRIAFVGDSFTYGWGIERLEDRFSDRIHTMFDRREPGRVEVMNVAKPGWDTGAEIQPVSDMIDVYGADEIVLCYVPNDIEKLLPRGPEFDPIRPPEPTIVNLSSSCLFDYLYRRVILPRVPTVKGYHDWLAEGFADRGIWQRHQEQLFSIVRTCRAKNVPLHVVLLPFLQTGGDKFQPAALHATLRSFFESNGVPVFDLLPTIEGRDRRPLMVNACDAHPNEPANALFAEAIWKMFYERPPATAP